MGSFSDGLNGNNIRFGLPPITFRNFALMISEKYSDSGIKICTDPQTGLESGEKVFVTLSVPRSLNGPTFFRDFFNVIETSEKPKSLRPGTERK